MTPFCTGCVLLCRLVCILTKKWITVPASVLDARRFGIPKALLPCARCPLLPRIRTRFSSRTRFPANDEESMK